MGSKSTLRCNRPWIRRPSAPASRRAACLPRSSKRFWPQREGKPVKLDLFFKNGLLVHPDQGVTAGSLGVKDGKIVVLCDPGERFDAAEEIDCGGRWIMPGVIDPHVHFGF